MKIFYLPIRSYGDFIITVSVLKDNFISKIPIILPNYFDELFHAINAGQFFDVQDTISYKNQPAFFELYKVKDLKNLKRLVNDIRTLTAVINKKEQYLVDYSSRRLGFTGAHLVWPQKKLNAYDGRIKLLSDLNLIKGDKSSANLIEPIKSGKMSKILILPDSRINIKSISSDLVNSIVNEFKSFDIKIAHFSHGGNSLNKHLYYSNFNELIALISSYDLVISAESLPYHLANYLKKPHLVIYNESRHFNSTFMTPFMTAHRYYSFFTGGNTKAVIADLNRVLTGN